MKLLTVIPYLTLAVASVLDPDLGPSRPRDLGVHKRMAVNRDAQVPALEERGLEKRQCDNTAGCQCQWVDQGQYCGVCWSGSGYTVTYLGTGDWNHVYECNPDGGCCDYGYATDCDLQENYVRCGASGN
ncbi:hypothetical protein DL768_010166 [Monosporascus sp. mg162]|nr:hypothetical protein DL768_010166 [Monosporascus sp. mg162]